MVDLRAFAVVSVLSLAALAITGCSGEGPQSEGESSDLEQGPVQSTNVGPSCSTSAHGAGCPCPREGERVECGTVYEKRPDGRTVCGPGGQVCEGGLWSACTMGGYAAGH